MIYTLTLQESHFNQLKSHLIRDDGKERAAFIICGRSLIEGKEDRFLSRETFLLEDEMLLASETYQVSWDNKYFIELLKKVESKNFALLVIHNHPLGIDYFSKVDDEGEFHLFRLAYNRNGGNRPHGSLIMMPDGSIIGRAWKSDLTYERISLIRVIGRQFKMLYPEKNKQYESAESFHRQQLAFGSALIQDLQSLKVCVVGAGATGSATATLLGRLGVKTLYLIDKDTVETSNLSRLHGAKMSDVGKYKVEVLKKEIESFGFNTEVEAVQEWTSNKVAIEKLKESDVIFCCTDDHAGRLLLNRFAYFYLTPVIDMGLVISVKSDPPEIKDLQGRISYLFPHSDCLITKGIINSEIANAENLQRERPDEYEKLKEEAYVIGERNPSPAVITFTTLIASLAVNEFLNRLIQFNPKSLQSHKLFFFHRNVEINPGDGTDKECRICGKDNYWGRGDMIPFLDMVI